MPIPIELPPDVEPEMHEEAVRRNLVFEAFARDWLAQSWHGRQHLVELYDLIHIDALEILKAHQKLFADDETVETAIDIELWQDAIFGYASSYLSDLFFDDDEKSSVVFAALVALDFPASSSSLIILDQQEKKGMLRFLYMVDYLRLQLISALNIAG